MRIAHQRREFAIEIALFEQQEQHVDDDQKTVTRDAGKRNRHRGHNCREIKPGSDVVKETVDRQILGKWQIGPQRAKILFVGRCGAAHVIETAADELHQHGNTEEKRQNRRKEAQNSRKGKTSDSQPGEATGQQIDQVPDGNGDHEGQQQILGHDQQGEDQCSNQHGHAEFDQLHELCIPHPRSGIVLWLSECHHVSACARRQ